MKASLLNSITNDLSNTHVSSAVSSGLVFLHRRRDLSHVDRWVVMIYSVWWNALQCITTPANNSGYIYYSLLDITCEEIKRLGPVMKQYKDKKQ